MTCSSKAASRISKTYRSTEFLYTAHGHFSRKYVPFLFLATVNTGLHIHESPLFTFFGQTPIPRSPKFVWGVLGMNRKTPNPKPQTLHPNPKSSPQKPAGGAHRLPSRGVFLSLHGPVMNMVPYLLESVLMYGPLGCTGKEYISGPPFKGLRTYKLDTHRDI